MQPPHWLRRHAFGIFQVLAIVYLMASTAYFTVVLLDDVTVTPRDALTLVLIGLIFIMIVLLRIRRDGQPDSPSSETVPIASHRSPGHVYRSSPHPVVARIPRARYENARDRFEETAPIPRGGDPNADEAAGFMRGMLAQKEDTGDDPRDWRAAT